MPSDAQYNSGSGTERKPGLNLQGWRLAPFGRSVRV